MGTRRERDAGRSLDLRENSRAARFQPRRLWLGPVIYRAEPSPSLTPLLRNYTQSVANKSKKVPAALVPIHETSALVRPPRLAAPLPYPFSREPPRLSFPVAKRANLCSQFDRDSGSDNARPPRTRPKDSASRSREIRASSLARFRSTMPVFVRLRD